MMHLITASAGDMETPLKVYATDAEAKIDRDKATALLAALWRAWPLDDAYLDDLNPEAATIKQELERLFPALDRHETIRGSTMHPDLSGDESSELTFVIHEIES